MPESCSENALEVPEEAGMVVFVSYPRGHHRYCGGKLHPFGDERVLSTTLAELLAWSLRRQGATVSLKIAQRQLALF